jgi:hypothetical protein
MKIKLMRAYEFLPQAQMPSTQERDLLAAHGHEELHDEPALPDEQADPVPVMGLHESTMLEQNTHAKANEIANL